MPFNFFRDATLQDMLKNPKFAEVHELYLSDIRKFLALPEAVFLSTVFDYIEELQGEDAWAMIFVLLLLLRQSVGGTVNIGN